MTSSKVSHKYTEVGGQGGHVPPQGLGYQFTLFGPMGADYAHHITTGPPSFWTMRRLCNIKYEVSKKRGYGFHI